VVGGSSLEELLVEEGMMAVWILGLNGDEERGQWQSMVDRMVAESGQSGAAWP
jgi:hypothetical protein